LQPDVIILAFDISDRATLENLKGVSFSLVSLTMSRIFEFSANHLASDFQWRSDITRYFQRGPGERVPVMMIGLKRDMRAEDNHIIYPQEVSETFTVNEGYIGRALLSTFQRCLIKSYRIAQELSCDRYAECSAVTGELVAETFEDIARVAAMTTTDTGGQSEGGCRIL
jgi:hypothetical protein